MKASCQVIRLTTFLIKNVVFLTWSSHYNQPIEKATTLAQRHKVRPTLTVSPQSQSMLCNSGLYTKHSALRNCVAFILFWSPTMTFSFMNSLLLKMVHMQLWLSGLCLRRFPFICHVLLKVFFVVHKKPHVVELTVAEMTWTISATDIGAWNCFKNCDLNC